MNNGGVLQILFIDPDTKWLNFAIQTLRKKGIRARCATDIGKTKRVPKFSFGPQLVFVDLEFAEKEPDQFQYFCERGNRYVVVLFPTDLTPQQMSRVFRLGAYDCVDKPYNDKLLVDLVEAFVAEVGFSILSPNRFTQLASNFILVT